ncbi:hypothetical protein TPHA_0C00580 [Tetrapisispora phaffii CBS 4417]|uniref:Uncharacterized protein n=1 Tax=Tetrapisispora phaffii (strain ATCC 24235 / CBS 4417 / NBRC 1672 / NRRL Y-8282 / UCD 70-5) TaxID=1071381 RepID=G8BR39_TETPH|nr:hypothetical protein TPHA_0C00580 [Tetrapisispora phaffii CBS 4417]CCE62215.1 hypothetical protein TPHA_0C00580 [Tetrapisispora phaffii CBS 4417]
MGADPNYKADISQLGVDIEEVRLSFINELDKSHISSLQVKSNIMCFVLQSGILFVIDLDKPSKVHKYPIPLLNGGGKKPIELLIRIWLSPNGSLLFLKTNLSNYYVCDVNTLLEENDQKPTRALLFQVASLSKNNYDINSLEWCNDASFLCGSKDGHVSFVDVPNGDLLKLSNLSVTTVLKLINKLMVYCGINKKNKPYIECIIVSDSNIMYWGNIDSDNPIRSLKNRKVPEEKEQFDKLSANTTNKFSTYEDRFSWVTANGVVFGRTGDDIDQEYKTFTNSNRKILLDANLFLNVELTERQKIINDIIMTDFYLILQRDTLITVINRLTNEIVYEEELLLNESENIIGLTADHSQEVPTYWCYSNLHVYEITISNKSHSVWKILCKQNKFNTAQSLLDINNMEKDMIMHNKGDFLFENGNFFDAATSYGNSSYSSFGSIALKFLESDDDIDPLQEYLSVKLKKIPSTKESQKLLLTSWILWTYLKKLNIVDEKIASEKSSVLLTKLKEDKEIIKSELNTFLSEYAFSLDKKIVLQLLLSQNRQDELLFYAKLISDFEFILNYWIKKEKWYEAQKSLLNITDVKQIYEHASLLLLKIPDSLIKTWMKIDKIDYVKLIPSLLTYYSHYMKTPVIDNTTNQQKENYALTYLLWCIKNYTVTKTIVYNTAIYMMISTFNDDILDNSYQETIINFMTEHENRFDINFVLRLSLKFKTIIVSIYLYSKLKLYEAAVNLALENNLIEFAKDVVNNIGSENDMTELETSSNDKLCQKLYLKIAKKVLFDETNNHDLKTNINNILRETNGILTIKELLPLFKEFTTIANLKDQIIKSLELHGKSMSQITQNIKSSMIMKEELLQDMEYFQERYMTLEPGVSCDVCQKILQDQRFYVFPCSHNFHERCIKDSILDSNEIILKSKIENIERKLNRENNKVRKMTLNKEMNKLLSTKCCLCSDININKIESYVLDMNNTEESMKWII